MAKLTGAQAAAKWKQNLSASTQFIQQGVQAVTESPTERAAAAQQKMLQNLTAAVQTGKWAANLRKVDLNTWKTRTISVGIPRIAQGAAASEAKFAAFATKLFAHQDRLVQQIKGMPDLTLQDSINRMITFVQGMAEFKNE